MRLVPTSPASGVIEAKGIAKRRSAHRVILKPFDLARPARRADCIRCPNGAAEKPHFFKMIDGRTFKPDEGTVVSAPDFEMPCIDQTRSSLDPNMTLLESLDSGHAGYAVSGQPIR